MVASNGVVSQHVAPYLSEQGIHLFRMLILGNHRCNWTELISPTGKDLGGPKVCERKLIEKPDLTRARTAQGYGEAHDEILRCYPACRSGRSHLRQRHYFVVRDARLHHLRRGRRTSVATAYLHSFPSGLWYQGKVRRSRCTCWPHHIESDRTITDLILTYCADVSVSKYHSAIRTNSPQLR